MAEKQPPSNPAPAAPKEYSPGDGIRSMRTTGLFRAVNYELYAKPVSDRIFVSEFTDYILHPFQNAVIMGIGLVCLLGAAGYIAYMRAKYEDMGYYSAMASDGTDQFVKKKSTGD